MHDARAIANYFLDRAHAERVPITALTLLKVLYFAHGWHLAKYGEPLVAQPFEAWTNGPVNRVVYEQVKKLRAHAIEFRLMSFDADKGAFVESSVGDITTDLEKFLNNIFDYYTRFDGTELSELTHEEGSPWDKVWKQAERHAVPGMEIADSDIVNWFRGEGLRGLRKQ